MTQDPLTGAGTATAPAPAGGGGDPTRFHIMGAQTQQAIDDLTVLAERIRATLADFAAAPPQPAWFSRVGASAGGAFLAKHQEMLAHGQQLLDKIVAQRDALQASRDRYVAYDAGVEQQFATMTAAFDRWSAAAPDAIGGTSRA